MFELLILYLFNFSGNSFANFGNSVPPADDFNRVNESGLFRYNKSFSNRCLLEYHVIFLLFTPITTLFKASSIHRI
uniref:Uncharacterized protein ORF CE005 n=1 Tax=Staphylococcus aureus TaxID=1280 RepID=F0V4V4_STAAU|nr:hypothetical protein R99_33 [Staphylococcus aureus]BAM14630.1 hypothetical protein [Staphylococcus aureus]BAU45651.1 hypothetical protein [Staphylococcus aureus]CBY88821.1 hypothetical protein [Staphylococcus aureus]